MKTDANQLQISGNLLEKSPCRYTPAGLPVVEGVLAHHSQQQEAGHPRQVQCQLRIIAVGHTAQLLAQVADGEAIQIVGFLAASSREPWRVRLHVSHLERTQMSTNAPTLPNF